MPLVWNVSPNALVLDPLNGPAVASGESIDVDDETAVSLCETADWSMTAPVKVRAPKSPETTETASPAPQADESAPADDPKE